MIESFKLPTITPETLTGSIVSFNDEYGGLPLKSCTSLISGYQEGSGTPSPDNVRPLHAFSSGMLSATGKNLIPDKRYQYNANNLFLGVDNSDITHTIYLNSGVYTFSISSELTGIVLNVGNSQTSYNITSNKYTFTVTTPDYYRFWVYKSGITSANIDSFQLEIGQATNYEPYNGNTYTFTFGQSIYQGSIDWKRGVVRGTHKYIEFNGGAGETWYFGSALPTSNRAYISVSDAKANSLDIASNYFKPSEATAGTGWGEPLTAYINSNKFFMCFFDVNDTNVYDLASWKTYLNTHTLQVAYELAEPIEIPLGGINLLTQEGQNNIFADCGDTEVQRLKVT